MRGLIAVAKERPFDGRLHIMPVDADRRLSITDVLASIENLPVDFADVCEARVNGDLVPREFWSRVYPKSNPFIDVAVTFTLPLRNGGGSSSSSGGGKSTLGTIASIAVLLVAAAVSGGALGLGAVGFLTAGAVNAIAGAAIGIGGALAVAALIPPPKASTNTADSSGAAADQALPASLTGNVLAPGDSVPRVIGTMRVFPALACPPLVEVVGTLEYAETVMVLSGPHSLSTVRVAGVDAGNIVELDLELQEGLSGSPRQSLVSRYGETVEPNVEIVGAITDPTIQFRLINQSSPDLASPQWFDLVTRDSPDEFWINLAWPEGLSDTQSPTTVLNQAVRTRFRLRGTSSWTNCPEVHFSNFAQGPLQKVIRLKWGAIPVAQNEIPVNSGPIYAYKNVPGQTVTPTTSGYTADAYFSAGAGGDLLSNATQLAGTSNLLNTELYQDKAIFYLNPATFPKGTYEVQVMRSTAYVRSNFTPSSYILSAAAGSASSAVYDFFKYYTDSSGLFSTVTDPSVALSRVVISRLSSVWNSNPIQSDDFATVSVRVHSRALDQVSVLASGYVRDWDGTAWENITTTSNPAPHFYDILTGTLGAAPLPASMVNSAELVAWRTACISLSYTCNAVIEGKSYQDALNLVASSGYARLRHNELWGVFLDFDRSAQTPIQVFTPRNMSGFQWTKAFAKLPSGIRAGFINSDLDYVSDEVIVYDDPDNPDGSNLEQITYDGLVSQADVAARAAFDLKQADLRLTFYSGQVDWESLVCGRGDLIGVQHDILNSNAGFARITGVTIVAGFVTGLTLEGTVPVASDDAWTSESSAWSNYSSAWMTARTGIAIRLKGGNGILTKQITGSNPTTSVTFSTPFVDPGSSLLDVDCLCAVGPLGSEYKRLIVYGIAPDDALGAKITFVDEAPELFA